MADMFNANLEKIFESINSTIRLAAEFGDTDQKNIKPYAELAEQLVGLTVKYNMHSKALQESSGEVTLEEFDRRYQSNITASKSNIKNLKRYKDFISQAKLLLTGDDSGPSPNQQYDEDLEVEAAISEIDPITKRPLEIPVRNQKCNHVYEKSSIESLIKNNARTRCPVMGCAASQYVTLADLVEDKMLQHKLMLQRRQSMDF
ncbi:E3 SUMO-protein ligase NSE2-like [Wyeomyia smithii]|uniref:E3 SUMO-protein ligase NSE2-like n=1 Tax=Wyeomyia smithii TaxID=174621 RepID=UPI00246800D0|nr:E3 SUMO-protein ligase NSE2-like [Wyeomyia smithii]XP_055538262.1 E3 SUMO-protein ligase NSE2-like [Wyeomyia smithii]